VCSRFAWKQVPKGRRRFCSFGTRPGVSAAPATVPSDMLASRPFGKGGAARRQPFVSSRRLFGAHNSAIAGGHHHAVDAATTTVAKESSGRVARDDSFRVGVGIAALAVRPQSPPSASTSRTTASRLSRNSGSRQSTGAPIGEPRVTTGGAAVPRLANTGSLGSAPDRPCFCVRGGICRLTAELPGGYSGVTRGSTSMLLARSGSEL
jgi:hypothetical protein